MQGQMKEQMKENTPQCLLQGQIFDNNDIVAIQQWAAINVRYDFPIEPTKIIDHYRRQKKMPIFVQVIKN